MKNTIALQERDTLVVNTELTLLSITQAIALSFLAEASLDPLVKLDFQWWPYIGTGLLVILVFWSRSLMHVLTIIRWPLRFAHNFIYICFTLVESVMFRQIGSIQPWFALSLASAVLIWILFAFDLQMVRRLSMEKNRPVDRNLIGIVESDQRFQLRVVVPVMVMLSALAYILVAVKPEIFLHDGWHLLLVASQLLFLSVYLWRSLLLYTRILSCMNNAEEHFA